MSILRALLAVLCSALLASTAAAESPPVPAEGLTWQWPDEGHRFLLRSQAVLPEVLPIYAVQNRDLRMAEFDLDVITHCVPRSVRRRAAEVVCTLEQISLRGVAVRGDQGRLEPVVQELAERYQGAQVVLAMGHDGRVRNVGLEGVERSNRREGVIHETVRLLMARTFAALDLQFPRRGEARTGTWNQRTPLAVLYPSDRGSLGRVEVDHRSVSVTEGLVVVESQGSGTVSSGQTVAVAGEERPANMYGIAFWSGARFDTGRGTLIERDYRVEGEPTASSIGADGMRGMPYLHGARLVYLEPGVEVPQLPPSGEIEPMSR